MAKETRDFEKDKEINPNRLHEEWLQHTTLHSYYAKGLREANRKLREAEQYMKVVKSELVLECQKNPEKCLGKEIKPTGPNVEAYYRTHKDHQEAKEDYFDALAEVESFQDAIAVLNSKKMALQELVKLLLREYFSGPTVPYDLREYMNERRDDEYAEQRERQVSRRTKHKS